MGRLSDYELHEALVIMRQRARRAGSQHALWDVILDIEAILKGERSLLTRDVIEREIEQWLTLE